MIPDEALKIFFFFVVVLVSFNVMMAGLSQVHDEVDELTAMENPLEYPQCQWLDDGYVDAGTVLDFPLSEEGGLPFIGVLEPDTYWRAEGRWRNPDREIQLTNIKFDNGFLPHYLEWDGEGDLGVYTHDIFVEGRGRFGFGSDFTDHRFEDIEVYYNELESNQTLRVTTRLIGQDGSFLKEDVFELSDENTVDNVNNTRIRKNLSYELNESVRSFVVNFNLMSDDFAEFDSPRVRGYTVNAVEKSEIEIRNRVDCAILVILEVGRAGFLNTGISLIDGFFYIVGAIVFVVALIITLPFFVLSLLLYLVSFLI